MSAPSHKLTLWMTREEFLTCWAYQFVAELQNAYGADQIGDEDREKLFGTVGSALRWAAAKLQHEHGFVFQGFSISEDGIVDLKTSKPVEPRNELYLYRFALGKIPHPVNAIETALRVLRDPGKPYSIDLEPFYVALAETKRAFEEAKKELSEDPEQTELVGKALSFLMNRAGYYRKDDLT